jgi:hypothetical protein
MRQSNGIMDLRIIPNRQGQKWKGIDIQKEEEIN